MRNLLLTLRYDGSAYHGWQIQENAVTVQEKLQEALYPLLGHAVNIYGSSRTDTGVHALSFCCNFKTDKPLENGTIVSALNATLPYDISVLNCREVPLDFHSRYSCTSKKYIYKILNSPMRDPFLEKRSFHYKYPLDEKMLNAEAQNFLGTHDFSAFCSSGSSVESKIRTVYEAKVIREGDIVEFSVRADGFLYNMVRIMVGTLLNISQGKIAQNQISEIIKSKERSAAGITAPPHGLYLAEVNYD